MVRGVGFLSQPSPGSHPYSADRRATPYGPRASPTAPIAPVIIAGFTLARTRRSWPAGALRRDRGREVEWYRLQLKGVTDIVAQGDNELVRVHAPARHQLARRSLCKPDMLIGP